MKSEPIIRTGPRELSIAKHKLRFLLPVIAVFHAVLVFSFFTPSLGDITGFAEAAYINSGRLLLDGILPPFGYSPLSAFFYALTYLPFQESPYWLIYSCSVGRLFLFGLLWSGAYLVANIFHNTQ